MSWLSDTSPEARRVLTEAYRAMSPAQKLRLLGREHRLARKLHMAGVRSRNPSATPSDVLYSWNAMVLGADLWTEIAKETVVDQDIEPIEVILQVARAFDSMILAYAIGGSWASSLYGEARFTRDADISVEPFSGREQEFADRFGPDYYVSVDAARMANRERSSFNLIHVPTAFKVDVFVQKDDRFEISVMARRSTKAATEITEQPLFWVSPEDIILLKLRWYRLGNAISERQWLDVLGVLKVQADKLDWTYLETWANQIGVTDLLARAHRDVLPGASPL